MHRTFQREGGDALDHPGPSKQPSSSVRLVKGGRGGGGAGKKRGFAFVAYEDQRSTTLAVDNLSGARITGRTIRVEHVDNYKRKKAEVAPPSPPPPHCPEPNCMMRPAQPWQRSDKRGTLSCSAKTGCMRTHRSA